MADPKYRADFNDDGTWFVEAPDGQRIQCGSRMDAQLTMACIIEAPDQAAEFERIAKESKS